MADTEARAALAAAPVTCQTYGPGTAVPCAECNQTLVDSQELAELRARVAAPQVPAAPQWRPIETAPTDTLVLLYGAKRSEMVVGMKHSRDGWVIDTPSEWAGMYPPTHWMPLPAAPGAPQPAEPAPQLQPLTADDIESLALDESLLLLCDDIEDLTEIVRAVEQMHGIRAADE